LPNPISSSKRPPSKQRIFISYRRDDTQWAAGRLSDSLASYFGDDRVFRDIDGIAGGDDFGHVISQTLSAADAVIVLIGRNWLGATDEQGRRRLDETGDWVVQEISTALEKDVPVYPVLVDGAPMPRSEELPSALRPLTRFNAISVSDDRWTADVSRLAKIVALDIPSETDRQLQWVNRTVSLALWLAIAFTLSVVYSNLLTSSSTLAENGSKADTGKCRTWAPCQLFERSEVSEAAEGCSFSGARMGTTDHCKHPPEPWLDPLSTAQSGLMFLVLVPASALLFVFSRHIAASRKRYFQAAAWIGAIGSFVTFVLYYLVCTEYESVVISYLGLTLAPLMLVLLGLSGFKAK
jgi:uncharacterized membrane protein